MKDETLLPNDLIHMAISAIDDLLDHCDPSTDQYCCVWADVPDKLRAALQSGNSAQPAGYVLVPVEPTPEMMLHKSGCQHHVWNDPDCPMRETRRLVWSHMLAAAPKAPDGWIPISEQLPERGVEVLACKMNPFGGYDEIEAAQWHGGMRGEQPVFITSADTIEPELWQTLPDAPKVPGSQLTPKPEDRLQKAIVDGCMVFLHGCDSLSKNYECDFSDSETETSFCIANIAKKIGVVEETGNRRWSLSQQMRGEIEEVYRKYAMRIMEAAPKVTP